MCLPLGERAFLIASHEATVPSNIGCKNGREPSRYAFAGQGMSPVSVEASQTGINIRVFSALLQDRGEVLTATNTSGNPNRADLDQLVLQGRQRPVLDWLWRRQRAQEIAEVVGKRMKLEPSA
jgi:hypothetical protein